MHFDVVTLSRLQFALTIMFHYLFPPLTIGMGLLLVVMEGTFLKTRNVMYEAMTKFWTKIYAVNFAMGVATGIVMEFEFGTNWASYSRFVGDVFGSALAAEGIFAFFLESGFLAVLVFGWERVSPKMHFFSTCMVSLGSIFSSVWIVIANSWQQTPAGYHLVSDGTRVRAEVTDFWAMVFNPSSMHRLGHVLLGAFILGAFFAMSIAAWYILRKRHAEFAKRTFTIALTVATIASLAALVSGDLQAKKVAQTQPAKLAAFEGHFVTGTSGTPLYLFGIPDAAGKKIDAGIAIPGLLSWLVHGEMDKPVTGLDQIPEAEQPPVASSFYSYHIMVAIGLFLILLTLMAVYYRWRGTLFERRWLMRTFVFAVLAPFAANQMGWVAAEVGRQPWIVYKLLKTSDGVSSSLAAGQVLSSIIMFGVIYLLLFAVWVYVLNSKIQHGPEEAVQLTETTTAAGLIASAARLADPAGSSLTSAHDKSTDKKEKE
jgi:cytochrome d ubiquinol oxidase subunit I